ncbi:MAG: polysaccharide biosynthesis/export family protein [Paludibacteraceae bacterium]|nr:polysaccharide biosynthesis/export family protein [Paludibacteraceae bacterium]MBR5824625.1 polysaccharide biosynthesis/export family protein [Paludibacteraceae bacterium]
MKQIYRYIIYMVAIMLLASCYPIRRVGLLQERSGLPEYEKGEYELYRLQKNDELELRIVSLNMETALLFQSVAVSSVANSSFTYRIYEDGTIDIPFLSKVKVAGLTLQQAEQKIENELSGFADDITVKLALSTGTFCVIGDAGRGYFPIYKDRLTIYQALALSGGVSPSADLGHVKILRRSVEGTKIIEFDIRPKSVIDSEYYYVYPNDVIYFDFSKRRFWAIDSYSGFLSVISSSLSMLVSVWNAFN